MSQTRSTQERRALFFTLFFFLSVKEKCERRGKEKEVKVPLIPISHQLSPFSPAVTALAARGVSSQALPSIYTHTRVHTHTLTCTSMCTGVWCQGLCFSLLLHKYYPVDHIALQLSPRNSICWTFSHVNIYGASLLVVFFFLNFCTTLHMDATPWIQSCPFHSYPHSGSPLLTHLWGA